VPTFAPTPEPQVVILRGVSGCASDQNVYGDNPIQVHYGIWGSIGKSAAEAAWDNLNVELTMDGKIITGEKQPVAPDLFKHCGSDAENIYWIFYIAEIEAVSPGIHHLEAVYSANEVIDDGAGNHYGPGQIFTHSFTLNATNKANLTFSDTLVVERLPNNPIIIPEMLPGDDGVNINGPSLIRVPTWLEGALGKYYLYFAHHIGENIRLAYADDLEGPWKIYAGGTLQLEDTICNDITGSIYLQYKHVASPDVHVDHQSEQIRMYFHCPVYISGPVDNNDSYRQVTLLATSEDGLNFEASTEHLGNAYFRVFQWDEYYYALSMPGVLYRSPDGISNFEEGPTLFSENMRHSAVLLQDEILYVFFSQIGDNPERILLSEIELIPDWMAWTATEPVTVLEPELDWEGGNLPLEPSYRGTIMEPVRQLRDPGIFVEDGRVYLLYSIAGETGIAVAEIQWR
jgi:hypothetical protein